MTADGAQLLWNGCKVAILLLRYIYSHSCTASAGPCMQVSICLEKTIYGFQMLIAALNHCA